MTAPSGEGPASPDRWRTRVRRLLPVVAIAAVTFGLFWCYLLQSGTQGADDDSSGQVLQGWDMVHNGNWLLSGWFVSDVSFYTFEVPVDGLVAAVDGLRADVFHVAAAIEYALLVLFAALLAAGKASDRRFGRREGLIRALVAVGVMVAPGGWQTAGVLLGAPDHTAIGVPVLVTLLVVDRVRPRRWWWAAGALALAVVLLVWAQLDDPVATLSCALPLAVVCGLSVVAFLIAPAARWLVGWVRRRRGRPSASASASAAAATVRRLVSRVRRRRGRSAKPPVSALVPAQAQVSDPAPVSAPAPASAWAPAPVSAWTSDPAPAAARPTRPVTQSPGYDAALAIVAAASFGLTELLVRAIWHAGGFYLHAIPSGTQLSGWASVPAQLRALWENLLILFGANFWVASQPQTAFAYLHLVGAAVAVLGLLIAIGRWRWLDRVTRALVVGVLVMLVAGASSPLMIVLGGTHEVAIVLPLGAVLGGRIIGPWLAVRWQSRPGWLALTVRTVRLVAICALSVVGLGLLSDLGYSAAQPAAASKYAGLADWLAANGLTSGLSGYWEANVTTLLTSGTVHLAPLTSQGRYGYLWESKATWFDPGVSYANFIVTTTQQVTGNDVSLQQVLFWYGQPTAIYQFQQYSIVVYDRNLLQSVVQPIPSSLSPPPGLDGEGRTTGEVPPSNRTAGTSW